MDEDSFSLMYPQVHVLQCLLFSKCCSEAIDENEDRLPFVLQGRAFLDQNGIPCLKYLVTSTLVRILELSLNVFKGGTQSALVLLLLSQKNCLKLRLEGFH